MFTHSLVSHSINTVKSQVAQMFNVSTRKHGGLRFFKLGRINISVSVSRAAKSLDIESNTLDSRYHSINTSLAQSTFMPSDSILDFNGETPVFDSFTIDEMARRNAVARHYAQVPLELVDTDSDYRNLIDSLANHDFGPVEPLDPISLDHVTASTRLPPAQIPLPRTCFDSLDPYDYAAVDHGFERYVDRSEEFNNKGGKWLGLLILILIPICMLIGIQLGVLLFNWIG
jgi:hypothetical protein